MSKEGQPGAVPDDIRPGLRKCGIGNRHHFGTFAPFGDVGVALKSWMTGPDFLPDIKAGSARSLCGGPAAHDLFMVMAKTAFLRGRSVKVISLSVLVNEVQGSEISSSLEDAQCLFLTPFYRQEYKQPLSDFQRLAVEDFLMERLDSACAVFTVGDRPLADTKAWWSSMLVQRLQASNVEVEVA